jgi:hypothetical protein
LAAHLSTKRDNRKGFFAPRELHPLGSPLRAGLRIIILVIADEKEMKLARVQGMRRLHHYACLKDSADQY